MAKSRDKGNRYERELCRRISEWFCEQSFKGRACDTLPFRRSPGSGAWERGGPDVSPAPDRADLRARWPFLVEAKHREGWDWFSFLCLSRDCEIQKWWKQCSGNARKFGLVPLLIFKKNLSADFAILPVDAAKKLHPFRFHTLRVPNGPLALFLLEELLKMAPSSVEVLKPVSGKRLRTAKG